MAQGYTVNTSSLAIRVGELRALTDAVASAAGMLEMAGGDLGPGGLTAAVDKLAGRWKEGLSSMTDRIDSMAGNLRQVIDNYELVEDASRVRFERKYGVS